VWIVSVGFGTSRNRTDHPELRMYDFSIIESPNSRLLLSCRLRIKYHIMVILIVYIYQWKKSYLYAPRIKPYNIQVKKTDNSIKHIYIYKAKWFEYKLPKSYCKRLRCSSHVSRIIRAYRGRFSRNLTIGLCNQIVRSIDTRASRRPTNFCHYSPTCLYRSEGTCSSIEKSWCYVKS